MLSKTIETDQASLQDRRKLRRWSSNTTPDVAGRLGVARTEDNSRMVIACHCMAWKWSWMICIQGTVYQGARKLFSSRSYFLDLHNWIVPPSGPSYYILLFHSLWTHIYLDIFLTCNFAITVLTFAIWLLVSGWVLVVHGVLWSRMRGLQKHLHDGKTCLSSWQEPGESTTLSRLLS